LFFSDFVVGFAIKTIKKGAIRSMEDIEKVLEQIKEWVRKLIEGLLNPDAQPELEPIPIPVNQPRPRR
jgi:predicted RNase H-like HicB family nuclease